MGLKLRVISKHYQALGPYRSWRFDTEGGSIGRAPDNDWILPDRNRYISRYHCTVSRRAGAWLLADTSKNGVFLNDDAEPLSSRGICTLHDGDRLSMGDYEVLISIDEDVAARDAESPGHRAIEASRDSSVPATEVLRAARGDREDLRSLLDEESLRMRAATRAGQDLPATSSTSFPSDPIHAASVTDDLDPASGGALHEETTLSTVADPDTSETAAAPRRIAPGPQQIPGSLGFPATDPGSSRTLNEEITFRVIPGGDRPDPGTRPDPGRIGTSPADASSLAVSSDERRTLKALLDEITFAAVPSWQTVPDSAPASAGGIELEASPLQVRPAVESSSTTEQAAAVQSADARVLKKLIDEVTLVVVPDLGSFGSSPGSAVVGEQHSAPAAVSRGRLATFPAPRSGAGSTQENVPASASAAADSARSPSAESTRYADSRSLRADPGFEAFCRAAGVDPELVLADERTEFLARAGHMLREATAGIMDALHTRTEVKATLQLDQTISERAANNPLKFLGTVNDVLLALLNEAAPRHLGPAEACREAFADLNMHQLAVLAAIRGALSGFLDLLEPGGLEGRFDQALSRDDVSRSMRKLRYWDLYRELHQRLARSETDGLPTAFLQEFGRSYEQKACDLLGRRRAG